MADVNEWLVEEIFGHRIIGQALEFTVKWTVGNNTWEAHLNVDELAALDQYLALLGVGSVKELLLTPKDVGNAVKHIKPPQSLVPAPLEVQRRSVHDVVSLIRLIETIKA